MDLAAGVRPAFPPRVVVAIEALACGLSVQWGLPLSRFSLSEIAQEVRRQGLVASLGNTTLWRWLHEDAIRPWHHRSWIFIRDVSYAEKAGRVLDLYQGIWEREPLGSKDFVISADEKTSIQAVGEFTRAGPHSRGIQ